MTPCDVNPDAPFLTAEEARIRVGTALGVCAAEIQGRVASAVGPDTRRRDAGDAERSSRSGNDVDGPHAAATGTDSRRELVRAHGGCGPSPALLVVDDATASPPPRAWDPTRKTHARGPGFLPRRLLALIELAAQVLEELPPPEAALRLEDRELYRYLHAGEEANHALVGRRGDETLERPAPDSALGAGRQVYEWSEEETERQFAAAVSEPPEQRS